tara:strand:+ start:654 stop:863 length:210 start_codon:yes stop_codon:yes gene_type:complete
MSIFDDPNFDEMFHNAIYNSREDVVDAVDVDLDSDEWDDDDQPTHYEECQDLYGGDDYIEQWEDDYGDY